MTTKQETEIDCEVSQLHFSLLQMEDMPFRTVDFKAALNGSDESTRLAHRNSNFSWRRVPSIKRSKLGLALMASPLQAERSAASVHEAPTRLTWFSGGLLLVVCLSLLTHSPNLIRAIWHSRQAAAEAAITRPNDPLEVASGSHDREHTRMGPIVFWIMLYILLSTTLIKYNKWLMTDGKFPFAVNLTLGHQISGSVFMLAMYKLNRALFPCLNDSRRDVTLSRGTVIGGLLPVALCFSAQLVLSNSAYVFASVAFLQMMKEGNIVLVYVFSLLVGLEAFHGVRAQVLFCLMISTSLTIQGEMAFSTSAFILQGTSQLVEASKIVLQGVLLSAAGSKHLDPYTYNLLVQPMCAGLLLVFLLACLAFITHVPTASLADYVEWWPHLLANCFVALSLNVTIANVFACTSAVSYIICGILKDVFIISIDVILSGTPISHLQVVAFALQLTFIASYSFLKIFQKELEPTSVDSNKKASVQ